MPSDNEHLNRQADSLVNTGSVTVVFVTFNSSEVIKAAIQAATETQAELVQGRGGAFDVVVDGRLIYSKHDTGRFPTNTEILNLLS